MFHRILYILILVGAAFCISGCASESTGTSQTGSTGQVSSIPWNRPEQWEGQGALGGMLNTH